ncbi:MAG TPA: hypothetical protein VI759_07500 [Dehalococcoidia bacterium]|nr:hypothetical protein [Dehalococcoidia bacterium]
MRVIERLTGSARFVADARRFLREEITPEQARAEIERRLARRVQSFLHVMEDGVYARPKSLYARLLQEANVSFEDLRHLVDQAGVEGALQRLYDAGVYVTNEEMKGRRPIKRGSLEILAQASDFANPFITRRAMRLHSSGSTGTPAPTDVDFNGFYDSTLAVAVSLQNHGIYGRPIAGLSVAGLPGMWLLWYAKIGTPLEKVFNLLQTGSLLGNLSRATTMTKLGVSVVYAAKRHRFVRPELSRHGQIERAAQWLARKRSEGTPAILRAITTPGVRVCLSAMEQGLDISGSYMRLGGEPFTPGKAQVLASAGVHPLVIYSTNETGEIGDACVTSSALDDLHLLTDRIAVIQRQRQIGPDASVGALVLSSVVTSGRRLLLNLENGDYATMEQRACGCLLGEIGLTTHLKDIRSHEKLTSGGVTFIGSTLHELIEEILPARFGGTAADYQLVEQEDQGITKVNVLVAPSVGVIDEAAVLSTVFEALRAPGPVARVWSEIWSQGETLRVVREKPHETRTAKVLPLHIVREKAPEK